MTRNWHRRLAPTKSSPALILIAILALTFVPAIALVLAPGTAGAQARSQEQLRVESTPAEVDSRTESGSHAEATHSQVTHPQPTHLETTHPEAAHLETAHPKTDHPQPTHLETDQARPGHPGTAPAEEPPHVEGEAHAEGSGGPPIELPDILEYLKGFFGGHGEAPHNWSDFLFAWRGPFFAIVLLLFLSTLLLRGAARREMIPGPFQNAVEYVVEAFYNFIQGILGPYAREFTPFLGTLFLYIWFMNLSGLIPLFKAPTSLFETTLSLALVVFLYVQITGFRKLGVAGYFHHLVGSPTDVMGWALVPLMLPLHIIGELAKPVSLSLRLFGNIMGEDVLIAVFTGLGVLTLSAIGSPIGIPLEFPFIFLGLLLSTIQALVFTLLSTIYFSQMLPHVEEHGH